MTGEGESVYTKVVIIFREGVPEVVPFEKGEEEEAEEFYEKASLRWSDSYLCRVERGPLI